MKQILQNARWIGLLLALLCGTASSECGAGPLLLRGTATVATAANGFNTDLSPSPLPLAAAIGDTFTFELSIDTQLAPGTPPGHRTTFSARIGEDELLDTELVAHVIDDALIFTRLIAEFIDIDSFGATGDQIVLFNPSDVSRSSGRVLSLHAPSFQTTFLFTSSLSVQPPFSLLLAGTQIPVHSTPWQAFSQREMSLDFANGSYLGAYITAVNVVPEPSAFSLLSCTLILLAPRLVRDGARRSLTFD